MIHVGFLVVLVLKVKVLTVICGKPQSYWACDQVTIYSCDRKDLESLANSSKIVLLVAEVVSDFQSKISRGKVDGHPDLCNSKL